MSKDYIFIDVDEAEILNFILLKGWISLVDLRKDFGYKAYDVYHKLRGKGLIDETPQLRNRSIRINTKGIESLVARFKRMEQMEVK